MLELSLFFGIVARFVFGQDVAGVRFAFCVEDETKGRSPFLYVSDLINLKGWNIRGWSHTGLLGLNWIT
jgi:hypothetical protein